MARTAVPVTEWKMLAASVTMTESGATNNDLVFTARAAGPEGNSIQIQYVEAGGTVPLSIEVVGQKIVVNLATTSGASTSTANDVAAAVAAHPVASQMVTVDNAASNDGSGLITQSISATNLTGGGFGPAQPSQTVGDITNGMYISGNRGDVLLEVNNTDAAPQTVTFKAPAAKVASGEAADRAETIAAGAIKLWGPFPTSMNQDTTNNELWFTVSDVDVKFRAYRVLQRT